MNIDQIYKQETRIFPYYQGKYLGNSPFGFSNIKSAKKHIRISSETIYELYFSSREEYRRNHEYFNGVYKNACDTYKWDSQKIFFRKDIGDELFDECKAYIEEHIKYNEVDKDYGYPRKFKEKYNMHPSISVDNEPYNKAYNKFLNEEIEYREGTVIITVKWNDGTVTDPPVYGE